MSQTRVVVNDYFRDSTGRAVRVLGNGTHVDQVRVMNISTGRKTSILTKNLRERWVWYDGPRLYDLFSEGSMNIMPPSRADYDALVARVEALERLSPDASKGADDEALD